MLGSTATLAIGNFMVYRNLDNSVDDQIYGVGIAMLDLVSLHTRYDWWRDERIIRWFTAHDRVLLDVSA